MSGPLLSVVIPLGPGIDRIQNVAKWLDSAIHQGIETILIQDSLNENEEKEIEKIIERISNQLLISEKVRFGNPGDSRNAGKRIATGEYIAFWDSDDIPKIENFLRMVSHGKMNGADVCIGGFKSTDLQETHSEFYLPRKIATGDMTEIGAYPGLWRFAFERVSIQGLNFRNFSMAEDQVFLLGAISEYRKFFVEQDIVYEYIHGTSNQLTNDSKSIRDISLSIEWMHANAKILKRKQIFRILLASQTLTILKNSFFVAIRYFVISLVKTNFQLIPDLMKVWLCRRNLRKNSESITIYLTGGLGNQLFQLAHGIQVSKGKNIIIADYKRNEILEQLVGQLSPNSYSLQRLSILNRSLNRLLVSLILRQNDSKIFRKLNIFARIMSKKINGKYSQLSPNRDIGYVSSSRETASVFIGYFQSYRYVDRELIGKYLNSNFHGESLEIINRYRALASEENPTLVHVRLGDYLNEKKFGVLENNYYRMALEEIFKHKGKTNIWLFSNEPDNAIKILSSEVQKGIRVVNEPKLSPLENLELMRMCSNFVIANSTYSWWAAYLSFSENPIVIYPDPWFKAGKSPADIAPPEWTSIPRYNYTNMR